MNKFIPAYSTDHHSITSPFSTGQPCQINQVIATPLACNGYNSLVSVNLNVTNPASQGFTLAGNGQIYGTFLYSDLPVTVGPLYGDGQSHYEFIAWDVENPECQNYVSLDAADCGPICSFSDFTMELVQCVTSTIAAVTIDFDHENTGGPTFDLYSDHDTSTYLYASLPVFESNFKTNGAAPITVTVCDHTNDACCQTFVIPAIDCNPNNCEIFSVNVDPECLNGNFVVHLDFEIDNPASDSFGVKGNTLNYGTFAYNQLPIVLGPLNGNSNINWQFIITDSENAACTSINTLGNYHCPPPCDILSMTADAVLCNGNDNYYLNIDMDIEGQGHGGFSLFSDNTYFGTFEYADLPVTIPDFPVGNFIDQITACDNEHPGCCLSTPFQALLCNGCLIYNLEANALPCNKDGFFYISINFNYQNVSSQGFNITGNGMDFGDFSYDDLPIQLGPFNGDGSQFFEFVVTDLENELCFDATELGTIPCGSICELSNLTVDPGECTGNNTYILHVDFDFTGTTGVGFDLYANGDFYDSYSYDDLPLTILEFPSNSGDQDTITVCDNDNSDCCATLVFLNPDCACSIYETTVQNLACTSDSTFAVSVEFFSNNLTANSVDVYVDGVFIGNHNIENMPFIVENIPEGDGTAILTICDHEAADCCDDVPIVLMDCLDAQCIIWNLFAEHGECTSDSTYVLNISFSHTNLPSDSVHVFANDLSVGYYLVQPDFIHITDFPVVDGNTTTITVCAVGNGDCCDTYVIQTPDCTPGGCEISDLVVFPGDCNSDSTYFIEIQYTGENIAGDSVHITANGNEIGTFVDPNHHIVIENFPWYGGDQAMLTLCSVAAPDCCDSYSFNIPNCPGNQQCSISDLIAFVGDCQSDSTYTLIVDFQFSNLPTDSVTITANDTDLGSFQVNEGHIVLENFPVLDGNTTTIQICATGAPDCCDTYEFGTPDCPGGDACHINELVAHVGDCQTDSTYILVVDFLFDHLPTDSVLITANDQFIGQFQVHEGHLVLENFPVLNGDLTTIHVCAVGAPDCCADYVFETPDCLGGGTCHIYDLVAVVGPCTSDSTYLLDVIFYWNNLLTDSVLIYANDQFIGTFHTDSESIHIEQFPVFNADNTHLVVCALGSPDCCDDFTFLTPDCGGGDECLIYDVSVQTADCNSDSTFGVVINFQYQNITGGFDVYTGDSYLGFFGFDQIPIQTSQFPANASGEYVVTICESDNFDCCTSFEFEGPVCGESACDISNFQFTLSDCDSAGNFFFILDFDFQHVGSLGFNIVGNDTEYGNFDYENLPIQLGPFPTDNTVYEFLVTDAEFPACFDLIVPGVVNCTVGISDLSHDDVFEIHNNGSRPGIYVKKDVTLSLFNVDGKMLSDKQPLSAGTYFELNHIPSGFYIANIVYNGNSWPVKLIKG